MENASKALIIAGGMLLAILVASLLVYAWGLYSKYQSSQDDLSEISDVAEFNEQFTNYDRDDVQGYELLSLINKVIDYNYRLSELDEAQSNDKYQSMKISINFADNVNLNKLRRLPTNLSNKQDNSVKLFNSLNYTQSTISNSLENIIDFASDVEQRYGGADCATRIAKSIDSIFLTGDQVDYLKNLSSQHLSEGEVWNNAIKTFNSYAMGTELSNNAYASNGRLDERGDSKGLKVEETYVYKYYEYMQFKRARFFSDGNIIYSSITGRVIEMNFIFSGEFD